ncbi:MAG: diguanylate cyclase domain-containing protein [Thiohalocapsa sp.]
MKSIRFGIIVIALCGVAALGGRIQVTRLMQQAAELAGRQIAATEQIIELRNAVTSLVTLESSQRGYLLTGDDSYLRSYQDRLRQLDGSLSRLPRLFDADAASLAEVEVLARLAAQRQQELTRALALRRNGDVEGALAIVKSGNGHRLMDEFRVKAGALADRLRRDLKALVAKEAVKFRQVSLLGNLVVVLMILLIAAAVGWLGLSIRRLDALQRAREREAMHDPLTGLPNRRYLHEWLKLVLAAAERSGKQLALLYFDLDGFKGVNDRLGHEAGDRVLQVIAERLRRIVRGADFVARLGGDEFVAVLPEAPTADQLAMLVERLAQTLARAPIAGVADGEVTASIGVASYPGDGGDAERLLKAADQAMYAAKQRRRRPRGGALVMLDRAAS